MGARIGKTSFVIVMALVGVFALWSVVFRLNWAALLLLVFAALFTPVFWKNKWVWAARVGGVVALAALTFVLWRPCAKQLGTQLSVLTEKLETNGPTALSLRDRAGLWGLHGVMVLGAYAWGLPEVAREAWAMNVPGGSTRSWFSDFPMRSIHVRGTLNDIIENELLPSTDTTHRAELSWANYRDAARDDSLRVALALNCPLVMDIEAVPHGEIWKLDVRAKCDVEYPKRHLIHIATVDEVPIVLDEGLFWALQELGWMFPFHAEWHFVVRTDDPRLFDAQPTLSWRERRLRDVWAR